MVIPAIYKFSDKWWPTQFLLGVVHISEHALSHSRNQTCLNSNLLANLFGLSSRHLRNLVYEIVNDVITHDEQP